MGVYLDRISQGVSKDVGEEKHIFKLNDEGFMKLTFQTPDGEKLKSGVEKLIGKMEIISRHAINQKKFKKSAAKRIKDLEDAQSMNVSQKQFNEGMTSSEQRILAYLREHMDKF